MKDPRHELYAGQDIWQDIYHVQGSYSKEEQQIWGLGVWRGGYVSRGGKLRPKIDKARDDFMMVLYYGTSLH